MADTSILSGTVLNQNDIMEECEVLEIKLTSTDPMKMFQDWISEAKSHPDLNEMPETMTLATIKRDGGPSARSVLMRGIDAKGFKMYWDKRSPKSNEINSDSRGALVFVWHVRNAQKNKEIRQVRVEGKIEELSETENVEYFNAEPLMAKIRAVVCHQSQIVTDEGRDFMIKETNRLWKSVEAPLEKPSYWGGYRLVPNMMEFYKGQRDAINDRIRFRKMQEGSQEALPPGVKLGESGWIYERLEP